MAASSLSGRDFCLGEWLVLPRQGRIRRGDETVHVSPRAMAVLVHLAQADGDVVSRNDILDAVWPRMAVTQDALSQCIVELRRAFSDNSKDPSVIESIPKLGIRLLVPIAPADTAAAADRSDGSALGALPEQADQPNGGDVDRAWPRKGLLAGLAVALSVLLVLAGVLSYLQLDGQTVLPNSVAVLPFENLSPDPEDAFFAAGLHQEILHHLTRISALNVIGRLSMLRYADTDKSIGEIAGELNVQTVLQTSVRYADGHIRVTPILIDAATGRSLWSDTYDEEFEDIFAIESDVATRIASALATELSAEERRIIATPPTQSADAYEAYLRAENLVPPTLALMDQYLDEAIRLDPMFALAHARRAQAYVGVLTAQIGREAADPAQWAELERAARASADTALRLDPHMGSAHVALGALHESFWRWTEALDEYTQGVRASPRDVPVRAAYEAARAFMGDYDFAQSIRAQREAIALNPLVAVDHWALGLSYAYSHDGIAAAKAFRQAVTLEPINPVYHIWLGHAEGMLGNHAEGLVDLQRAEQLPLAHESSITIANLAYAYARNGDADRAKRLVALLTERAPDRHHQAGNWALAYLAVGDAARARESLETVITKIAARVPDAGFLTLRLIKANIYSDPVLEEPAFRALREQLRGQ